MQPGTVKMEKVYAFDHKSPPGRVRAITDAEIWRLQGRNSTDMERYYLSQEEAIRATGGQTAAALFTGAGNILLQMMEQDDGKAGMGADVEGAKALAQLVWLRKWRQGDFPGTRLGGPEPTALVR